MDWKNKKKHPYVSESKVLVQVLLDYKSSDHFNLKFYIFESSDHRSNIIVYKLLTCNYSDFDFCVLDLLLIYSLIIIIIILHVLLIRLIMVSRFCNLDLSYKFIGI